MRELLDSVNSKDGGSSEKDETSPIVAEVIHNSSSFEKNEVNDVSEFTGISQDGDDTEDCISQTELKLDSLKRKHRDIESQTSEEDTSLSSADHNKKALTPTKKLFKGIFKDSPSAPSNASTSKEFIDLTKIDHTMELLSPKSVPETVFTGSCSFRL